MFICLPEPLRETLRAGAICGLHFHERDPLMIHMISAVSHTVLGKGVVAASGMVAGISTFAISEVFTGNLWIAVILSAISSIAVAWFASRPKVIQAQSAAEMDERASIRKDFAELWERAEQVHHEETRWMRQRLDQQNKIIALLTITKHALLNENQAITFYIDDLRELLRANQIAFSPFRPAPIYLITQEEDKARAEIMNLPASIISAVGAIEPEAASS